MTGPTNATGNAVLVNALSSSVRSTINGMESVPGLVRQVLEEGSWRSFTTPRGSTSPTRPSSRSSPLSRARASATASTS